MRAASLLLLVLSTCELSDQRQFPLVVDAEKDEMRLLRFTVEGQQQVEELAALATVCIHCIILR